MGNSGRIWAALAVGCLVLGATSVAEAQVVPKPQAKTFRPARPIFSPYFELSRPLNTSPGRLPQYYTFYQRDLQYRAELERQAEINQQSQATIQQLQGNLKALQAPRGTGTGASYRTEGGYFRTHSGYFNTR